MHPRFSYLVAGAIASIFVAHPAEAATSSPMRLHSKKQNLCLDPPGTDGGWPGSGATGGVAKCTPGRDTYFVHTPAGELRNELKGHCLDAGGRLAPCDGGGGQRWTIVPRGGGWFALKNNGAACMTASSGPVGAANCDGPGDELLWSWESTGMALVHTHEVERKIVAGDGLCLGITADSTAPGAAVVRASCANTGARWQLVDSGDHLEGLGDPLVYIRSRHSGLCLDVPNGSDRSGVLLQQWTCNSQSPQRFALLDEAGRVKLMTDDGLCLEFDGDGVGARLRQTTCTAGPFAAHQRFDVTGRRPQRLRNKANDLCLDAPMWAGGDGQMSVAPCDDGRDQLFVRNTDWELVSLAQGKCLDVAGLDAPSGAQVNLWKCENDDDQRWTFGGTEAEIKNKRSGLCLDLPGYVGKTGDPVKLYACDGGPDQRWSWDETSSVTPPAPPRTLAFTAPVAGKDRLCAAWGQLCVRGDFAASSDPSLFTASGDVAVETPLGIWTLQDANLSVDLKAPKIAGSALVTFPALGLMSKVINTAVQAEILIGPGDVQMMPVGKSVHASGAATFARDPDRFYVYARLAGATKVKLPGGASTIELGPDSVLLVEPSAPTVYVEGGIIKALPIPQLTAFDAIGFSLGPCFTRVLTNPLRGPDGKEGPRSVCGHILASATISYKLLAGTGTLVVDIDADRDGVTVFDGDANDYRVAYDGSAQVDKAILDLPLGGASIYFDGKAQRLDLAATGARSNLFAGTPLAPLNTGGLLSSVQLGIDSIRQDFWLRVGSATILGWQATDIAAQMGWDGASFVQATAQAKFSLPLKAGTVSLDGVFKTASDWSIEGKGALDFAGKAKLAAATVTLADDGMAVKGDAEFGGIGPFAIQGKVTSGSSFSLSASVTAKGTAKAGIDLASAEGTATLTIDQDGARARFKGKAKLAGVSLAGLDLAIASDGTIKVDFGLTTVEIKLS